MQVLFLTITLPQLLSHQECPRQLFLNADLHSRVGKNNRMGEVSHLLIDSSYPVAKPWMIVARLACELLLIQYSHVGPQSRLSVRQTARLACVSAAAVFNLTPACRIKACGWRWQVTGQAALCSGALGSCVNHPARLSSEDPRGVFPLTDGITAEPQNLQSR